MSPRRVVVAVALFTGVELFLEHVMARGHVAHALLGSGSEGPSLAAALLAAAFVALRVLVITLAPGALLAALTWMGADAWRRRAQRGGPGAADPDGGGGGDGGSTDAGPPRSQGTSSRSGDEASVVGAGTIIGSGFTV